MDALGDRLREAARAGDLAALQKCLAAGVDPDARGGDGMTPLHKAAFNGQAGCVAALLAVGADTRARTGDGATPLHGAAYNGCAACVAALLAAGSRPSAVDNGLQTPLHTAAYYNRVPALRLLAADPAAAALRNSTGRTPLQVALRWACIGAARCLLELGAVQPAGELLAEIEQVPSWRVDVKSRLYSLVAAHQPLTPAQWARVPSPSPALGAALPAVLGRFTTEARLLVQHLSPMDRERLRVLALCLARAQRQGDIPLLPADVAGRLLAWSPIHSPTFCSPGQPSRRRAPPRSSSLSRFLHACRSACARLLGTAP